MPELPEVETTRRGLEPHLVGAHILQLVIRQHQLRWPVPKRLASCLHNTCITAVRRRAKYLLDRDAAAACEDLAQMAETPLDLLRWWERAEVEKLRNHWRETGDARAPLLEDGQ